MNKAVILDRDGVINEDTGYVHKIDDFRVLSGVYDALKRLQDAGFRLIVITNQSGIGRGYYTERDFLELNDYMIKLFAERGIKIEKTYYCPHKPEDGCKCRKPSPLLCERAIKEYDLSREESWVVGDKMDDARMGEACGLRTILVESNYTNDFKTPKMRNLGEAAEFILKNGKDKPDS
ncbi:MAG: D-glycero-beta-D-manno-heptose 1,7-bisphosphate 7-phosphatase [archaeon]|nr:D-glycero-beta-D-manno-heptose 1,7-bisphosphate 7-phosphatase [archaeon]